MKGKYPTPVIFLCVFTLFCSSVTAQERRDQQSEFAKVLQAQDHFQRQSRVQLLIQPGTETQAKDYYARISDASVLNFPFEGSTLDSLLEYMGYTTPNGDAFGGLLARDLETLPSFTLMPRDEAEFANLKSQVSDPAAFDSLLDLNDFRSDKVLVSRFFAPKIATYYDAGDPFTPVERESIVPGWRKLVRLTARPASRADKAGVQHLYLLFNVKQPDPDADPFAVESANNQVIIVPRDQNLKDSAYFAVYGRKTPASPGAAEYPLGYFLAADFDLPGHVGVELPGAKDGKYFVPRSCAECHGHSNSFLTGNSLRGRPTDPETNAPTDNFRTGVYRYAKPNYLDTDQWYDWMEFDFRGVTTSLNDVVFDGGKSHGSTQYDRAFSVIRKLNTTIRDQTFEAEQVSGTKSYSTLAAEKWLSLHASDNQRIPYSLRGIGNEQWNTASRDEMRLLRLLNNHCFRCHSSVIYNVFDREAVRSKKTFIDLFLKTKVNGTSGNPLPGFRMPQGRVLESAERDEMLRLLKTVFP